MKILVCPLNWGLGHATRCIPLIRQWVEDEHEVVIVADGHPLALLRDVFPELRTIRFSSYRISYSPGKSQVVAMLKSLPNIVYGIFREHLWLTKLLEKEHFDRVVSDNRFGMWSRRVESVYITHQLRVKMPRPFRWLEPLNVLLHRFLINRYSQCWIPDYEGPENLSGELSHGLKLPSHCLFIGPLSRFQGFREAETTTENYDWVMIISGPEPQRTLFEAAMTAKALEGAAKTLLVRGLPGSNEPQQQQGNLTIVNHLADVALASALIHCNHIFCRSGYSTLMDLHTLGCLHKAVLIPTPGQTEQEYLAGYHQKKTAEVSSRGC